MLVGFLLRLRQQGNPLALLVLRSCPPHQHQLPVVLDSSELLRAAVAGDQQLALGCSSQRADQEARAEARWGSSGPAGVGSGCACLGPASAAADGPHLQHALVDCVVLIRLMLFCFGLVVFLLWVW